MEQRGLRPCGRRAGARVGEPGYLFARPERARDDGHPRAGIGGAEAPLAAAYGQVREDRLFRADRTRCRKRPWLAEYDGRPEGRRLRTQWREEVDRQRILLSRGRDLGQNRRRYDLRFPRRNRESRVPGRRTPPQGVPARRLADAYHARGLPRARGCQAAESRRPWLHPLYPHALPLRRGMGRAWAGDGLL